MLIDQKDYNEVLGHYHELTKQKTNSKLIRSIEDILFVLQYGESKIGKVELQYYELFKHIEELDFNLVDEPRIEDLTIKYGIYFDTDDNNNLYILDYEHEYGEYCDCNDSMEGYFSEFDCCGENCDWDIPKLISKDGTDLVKIPIDIKQKDYFKFLLDIRNQDTIKNLELNKLLSEQKRLFNELREISKKIQKIK